MAHSQGKRPSSPLSTCHSVALQPLHCRCIAQWHGHTVGSGCHEGCNRMLGGEKGMCESYDEGNDSDAGNHHRRIICFTTSLELSTEVVCVWILKSWLWMCLHGHGGIRDECEMGERWRSNSREHQDLYISETDTKMEQGWTLFLAMSGCQLDSN